jgi:hypothetical protein
MPDLAVPETNAHQTALDAVLAKTGAKDRTHIQRHLTAADAEPDPGHAALWRKLAELLASLAPLPVQAVGHTAVMFFVPDGKYRMQAFALEDQSDGRIALYLPDILADAVKKKILKKLDEETEYGVVGSLRAVLHVESLDAQNTPEPATHVKNMLGWNRKSLKITLPIIGTDRARLAAVETLCNLAAKQWAGRLAAAAATTAPAAATPPPRAPKASGSKKRSA